MRNNLNELIRKQLVSQFENVVKEEIRQHNLAIERNDKSLKELQEAFREFHKDYGKLQSTNEVLYQKNLQNFNEAIDKVNESFDGQRTFIRNNDERINKIIIEFEKNIDNFISHDLFFTFKTGLYGNFDYVYKKIKEQKQELKKSIYESYSKNKSLIQDYRIKSDERFHVMDERFRVLEKSLEEYKIDSKGVLKELQVYKKTAFIMEKKIENLYTLVERLNKRMDV